MFRELVGSTSLAVESDPEDVAGAIGAYHTNLTEIVVWRGGHIAKFMGERVLAYFGWPHAAVEYGNTYGLRPSVTGNRHPRSACPRRLQRR